MWFLFTLGANPTRDFYSTNVFNHTDVVNYDYINYNVDYNFDYNIDHYIDYYHIDNYINYYINISRYGSNSW